MNRWETWTLAALTVFAVACSGGETNNTAENNGADAANNGADGSGGDTGGDASGGTDATADAAPDGGGGFSCDLVDCPADKPTCSPLAQACVECLADNDCAGSAPRLTCNAFAEGDAVPPFECVECVRDEQCGGATCDLATHTCM